MRLFTLPPSVHCDGSVGNNPSLVEFESFQRECHLYFHLCDSPNMSKKVSMIPEANAILDSEILKLIRSETQKPASVNLLRKRFNVGWGRAKRLFKLCMAEALNCTPGEVPILPPGARPGQRSKADYSMVSTASQQHDLQRKSRKAISLKSGRKHTPEYIAAKQLKKQAQLILRSNRENANSNDRIRKIAELLTPDPALYFTTLENAILSKELNTILAKRQKLQIQRQRQEQEQEQPAPIFNDAYR